MSLKHCGQCFIVDVVDKPFHMYLVLENTLYCEREKLTREKLQVEPAPSGAGAAIEEASSTQTKLLVANSMNNGISQMEKAI